MACWPIYNLNQLSFIRIDVQPTGAQPFGSLPNFTSYPFRNITQLKLTWLKLWNLVEIVKFGWNCAIWLKLWNLVEIVRLCRNINSKKISNVGFGVLRNLITLSYIKHSFVHWGQWEYNQPIIVIIVFFAESERWFVRVLFFLLRITTSTVKCQISCSSNALSDLSLWSHTLTAALMMWQTSSPSFPWSGSDYITLVNS